MKTATSIKRCLLSVLFLVTVVIPAVNCMGFLTFWGGESYPIIKQPLLVTSSGPFVIVGDIEEKANMLFNSNKSYDLVFLEVGNNVLPLDYPEAPVSDPCGKIGRAIYKAGNTTKTFYFQVVCFSSPAVRYPKLLKPFASTYYTNLNMILNTTTQTIHFRVVNVETGDPIPSVSVWVDQKFVGYTDVFGDINLTIHPGKHVILGLSSTQIGAYAIDTTKIKNKSTMILPLVDQFHEVYYSCPFSHISTTPSVVPISNDCTLEIVTPYGIFDQDAFWGIPPIPPIVLGRYSPGDSGKYSILYYRSDEKTAFRPILVNSTDFSSRMKLLAHLSFGTTLMILDNSGQVAHGLHVKINSSKPYNLTDGFLYYPTKVNTTYKKGSMYDYVFAHIKPQGNIKITIDGKDYERCEIHYQEKIGNTDVTCKGCDCLWSTREINETTLFYKSAPKEVFMPMPGENLSNPNATLTNTSSTNRKNVSIKRKISHVQILAIILKKKISPTIFLPNISTPCKKGWPAHTGEIVTYNEPNFACDVFEVHNNNLKTIVKKIYSECHRTIMQNNSDSIYSWYINTYLPLYSVENFSIRDKLKICAGLHIIELLSSSNGPMEGYFYPEVCCSKTKWCPKKEFFGLCGPKSTIFSKNALSLECKGSVSQYPRGWVSDTDMSKNSCVLSDLPAHVSVSILKTGTCADYSIALTTLLRIAGFSSDEVYTVRGSMWGGHIYNLVKFPGDYKYTVVDTTGNNPFSINLQNVPGNKDYCNYDIDKCSNDAGLRKCPPKWQVWGC